MPDIDDIWDGEEDRAQFATPRALDRPTTSQHRAPQPAASVDREALVDLIATCLDHPSAYMGGPSDRSTRTAAGIADTLIAAGWHNRPEAVVRDETLREAAYTASEPEMEPEGRWILEEQRDLCHDAILALRTTPSETAGDKVEALVKAAQAVVARWDSIDWKAPPTAEVMNELRRALASFGGQRNG